MRTIADHNHIVDTHPFTKFEGRFQLFHAVDDDTLNWPETTATVTLVKWNESKLPKVLKNCTTEVLGIKKAHLHSRYALLQIICLWAYLLWWPADQDRGSMQPPLCRMTQSQHTQSATKKRIIFNQKTLGTENIFLQFSTIFTFIYD